jgi:hypothetical protein
MALRQQILGSRRIVLRFDGAIDFDNCCYSDYRESHYDIGKLQQKNGEDFTVFVVEPLTRKQKLFCANFSGRQHSEAIVQCGLRNVENYVKIGDSGQPHVLGKVKREDTGVGLLVTDKWMDEANFLEEETTELAAIIEEISEVRPPLLKPSNVPPGPGVAATTEVKQK